MVGSHKQDETICDSTQEVWDLIIAMQTEKIADHRRANGEEISCILIPGLAFPGLNIEGP
jgi:hypothetical protein